LILGELHGLCGRRGLVIADSGGLHGRVIPFCGGLCVRSLLAASPPRARGDVPVAA
jgi:hypothetical protein